MSKKIAVIGIGNTLRRDDGIGIIILESLLNFYKRQDIDYFNFGSGSFDLIHKIKNYDTVLLIDAINADLPVGELKIFKPPDIESGLFTTVTSTHEFNLKNIFGLLNGLGFKTKVYVAGIQVEETSCGEGLSDTLKNKKEDIIKKINTFINETLCFPH